MIGSDNVRNVVKFYTIILAMRNAIVVVRGLRRMRGSMCGSVPCKERSKVIF